MSVESPTSVAKGAPSEMLFAYVAESASRPLPLEVAAKGRLHLLDTIAAIVSGSELKPGRLARRHVRLTGGRREATLVGSTAIVPATQAALAHGIMAHADETDDSHLAGRCHPGCAVVPAALAMAERAGADGSALLRAVVLGYDVGVRVNLALGADALDASGHSTHSIGPSFGAAAAAGAIAGLCAQKVGYVMSYAAQQASGVKYWVRDEEHVEKAFDFGGMPARNGVTAAILVLAGFSALRDPFTGPFNFLEAFSGRPNIGELTGELGSRFEVMRATIKKWSVGSPIQAALDALEMLMAKHHFRANDVVELIARLPDDRAHVVNDRNMPDINLQHMLAVMLLDGTVTFGAAHDYARMHADDVRYLKGCMTLVPDRELTDAKPARQAVIDVVLKDGQRLSERTYAVRGTPDNPMSEGEVRLKAHDLLQPVLGREAAAEVIRQVLAIEELRDVRMLGRLLATGRHVAR